MEVFQRIGGLLRLVLGLLVKQCLMIRGFCLFIIIFFINGTTTYNFKIFLYIFHLIIKKITGVLRRIEV